MLEIFGLRASYKTNRGLIWELMLWPAPNGRPDHLHGGPARCLVSASAPQSIAWLRTMLLNRCNKALPNGSLEDLKPGSDPIRLEPQEGMRLALAFGCARYLTAAQRQAFEQRLYELPPEVLLYWFTLCFYGNRTAAAKAALRELLIHESDEKIRPVKKRVTHPNGIRIIKQLTLEKIFTSDQNDTNYTNGGQS